MIVQTVLHFLFIIIVMVACTECLVLFMNGFCTDIEQKYQIAIVVDGIGLVASLVVLVVGLLKIDLSPVRNLLLYSGVLSSYLLLRRYSKKEESNT